MNVCITTESVKLISSYFNKNLSEFIKEDSKLNDVVIGLFNKAIEDFKLNPKDVRDKEVLVQHLSVLPQLIKAYDALNPNKVNTELLQEATFMSDQILKTSSLKNDSSFTEVLNNFAYIVGMKRVTPLNYEYRYNFVATLFNKTFSQDSFFYLSSEHADNVKRPELELETNVIRNVIKQAGAGYRLKLVSIDEQTKNDKFISNAPLGAFTYGLVLVNEKGEDVFFNELGQEDVNGTSPILPIRHDAKTLSFKAEKWAEQLAIDQNIEITEAVAVVKQILDDHINELQKNIKKVKNGEEVLYDINLKESSLGFVELDRNRLTPLKGLVNNNEFNFYVEAGGAQNYYANFNIPKSNVISKVKPQELKHLTEADIDIIVELMLNADLMLNGKVLTFNERKDLLRYYMNVDFSKNKKEAGAPILDLTQKTKKLVVQINGMKTSSKAVLKKELTAYFNTPVKRIAKSIPEKTAIVKEQDVKHNMQIFEEEGVYYEYFWPLRDLGLKSNTVDFGAQITYPLQVTDNVLSVATKTLHQNVIDFGETYYVPTKENLLIPSSPSLAYVPITQAEEDVDVEDIEIFRSLADINRATATTLEREGKATTWFNNHPLRQIIALNFIDDIHEKGPSFVASYLKGAINLYLGSENTDIYHEAFHSFTQSILTEAERKDLYKELSKLKGTFSVVVNGKAKTVEFSKATELELEEYLAERFREYATNKKSNVSEKIKNFFERILNILKSIFGDMSFNEAVTLNKVNGVVNTIFYDLYEGNIDISKFNPQASKQELFQSLELKTDTFTKQEIKTVMESMHSIYSDYVKYAHNRNNARKKTLREAIFEQSFLNENEPRFKELQETIDSLSNVDLEQSTGIGLYYLSQGPGLRKEAMQYVVNILNKKLQAFQNSGLIAQVQLLNKVLDEKNLGSLDELETYYEEDEYGTLLSLFINEYSGLNITDKFTETLIEDEEDENGTPINPFENKGNEKSIFETLDEKTKYLLSSIVAHSYNGKGSPITNMLGVGRLRHYKEMTSKVAKLLANVTDRVEMYEKLKAASKTDKEIKQLLLLLGNLNYEKTTATEQQQWTAFRQSFDKATILMYETTLIKKEKKINDEEVAVSIEYQGGNAQSSDTAVLRDWRDSFKYRSQESRFKDSTLTQGNIDLTKLVKEYKGELYVKELEDGSFDITNKQKEGYRAEPKYLIYARDFLNEIGITLAEDVAIDNRFLSNKQTDFSFKNNLQYLYSAMEQRQFNNPIAENLDFIFNDFYYFDKDRQRIEVKGNKGFLKDLALLELEYNNAYGSFMSTTAEGNPISEKSYHSSLTYILTAINKADSYERFISMPGMEVFDYRKNPIVASSKWLVDMFQLDSKFSMSRGKRNWNVSININNLSGSKIRYNNDEKGRSSITLSELDKFVSDLNNTLNNRQEIMRAEAKSTSLTVSTPTVKNTGISDVDVIIGPQEIAKINNPNNTENVLLNNMMSHIEYDLIRLNNIKALKEKIKAGEEVVFDAKLLNRIEENTFYAFDSIFPEELKKALIALNISESFSLSKALTPVLAKEIETRLRSYFNKEADWLLNEFGGKAIVADNIYDKYKVEGKEENDVMRDIYLSFVTTNYIQNLNFSSLFLGDPINYNVEEEDYHKRLAGLISSGTGMVHDKRWMDFVNSDFFEHNAYSKSKAPNRTDFSYNGYLNTAIIKEKKSKSEYLDEYADIAGVDVKEYKNMKEADGAGWISLDAYRLLARSSDEWSIQQENIYKKIVAGEFVEEKEVLTTFPIRKYQYFGPLYNETAVPSSLQAFHKYSLFPLIPTVIKGKKLELLHQQMMEQGIDYVTMESGSKLASLSKVIYDEKEKTFVNQTDEPYTENRELKNITLTSNKIHVKFLKSQVYQAEGYKKKISIPTQMRKLIYLNTFDNGIPVDYTKEKEWTSLTEKEKLKESPLYKWSVDTTKALEQIESFYEKELLEELGLKVKDGVYTGDTKKIGEFLKNALKSKDITEDEIGNIFNSDGTLVSDLSLSLFSEQIEKVLVNLVDKKLRKLKIKGEALVQVPNTMFEPIGESVGEGTNELAFYHAIDKNGNRLKTKEGFYKIAKAEVKIAMQGDFKKLLTLKEVAQYDVNEEGKRKLNVEKSRAKLNELIKTNKEFFNKYESILTIPATRIPSQSENSIDSFVVKEFLNESLGPAIVLPAEIVAKAGSDYDIDKLFAMFKSLIKVGDNVEEVVYKENKLSVEELKLKKSEALNKVQKAREAIQLLYKERNDYYKTSTKINKNVIKALNEQYGFETSVFKERSKTSKLLRQAENKKGRFENMGNEKRNAYIDKYTDELKDLELIIEHHNNKVQRLLSEEINVSSLPKEFYNESNAKLKLAEQELKNAENEYDNVLRDLAGKTVKGLENNLMNLYSQRVTMPSNFEGLVHPNDTNLLLGLAKKMEKVLSEKGYDKTVKEHSTSSGKIARNTIYSYRYNLLKHQENSVGKDSLGIAAVAATFSSLFSVYGASIIETNPQEQEEFEKALSTLANNPKDEAALKTVNKYRQKTLRIDHNKIKDSYGNDIIALGFLKNKNEFKISVVIEQLMNGYVDVAKDAWIFNIQGNKQNTPVILFLAMAGVKVEDIVHMTSNPLIIEYNKIKQELDGMYSLLNKEPGVNPVFEEDNEDYKVLSIDMQARNKMFANHAELLLDNGYGTEETPLKGNFFRSISNKMKQLTSKELEDRAESKTLSFRDVEILAHYMEIETMVNSLRKFMDTHKSDTKKTSTLSEAYNNIKKLDDLIAAKGSFIPFTLFESFKNNPVGIFNKNKLVLDIFDNKFALRNDELLLELSSQLDRLDNILPEVLSKDYANDFLWFLYQNSIYKKDSYLGYRFNVEEGDANSINDETKTYNIGKSYILKMRETNIHSQLAQMGMFPTAGHELRYLFEYKTALEEYNALGKEAFKKKYYYLNNNVTDGFLISKLALYRADNEIAMFNYNTSVANILKNIIEENEDLKEQYEILNDLRYDYKETTGKHNMYLKEIKDPDMARIYKENVFNLRNHPLLELRELFGKLDHIAMMQTGLARNNKYDLGKLIINQNILEEVIDNGIGINTIYNELNKIKLLKQEIINKHKFQGSEVIKQKTEELYIKLRQENNLFFVFDEYFRMNSFDSTSHKNRTRGRSYIATNYSIETVSFLPKLALQKNNVYVFEKESDISENLIILNQAKINNKANTYEKMVAYLSSLANKEIGVIKQGFVLPKDADYSLEDLNEELAKLGIINNKTISLAYVTPTVAEGKLSIAAVPNIKLPHGIKDEAMANNSTKAIGVAFIANPKYNSSSQNYLNYLEANNKKALDNKFTDKDSVWLFGSGTGASFKNAFGSLSEAQYTSLLANEFEMKMKPLIDKAIKKGVATFNVGVAEGIDEMASNYLREKGFVSTVQYTKAGKFLTFNKSKAESKLYDVNLEENTPQDLIEFKKRILFYTTIFEKYKAAPKSTREEVESAYDNLKTDIQDHIKGLTGNVRSVTLRAFRDYKAEIKLGTYSSDAIMESIFSEIRQMFDEQQKRIIQKPKITTQQQALQQGEVTTFTGKVDIASLKENEDTVFGSNQFGYHGGGTAGILYANDARAYKNQKIEGKGLRVEVGKARGFQTGTKGSSYAIQTVTDWKLPMSDSNRQVPQEEIIKQIQEMYAYYEKNPNRKAYVLYTADGKNLNGYTDKQMVNMFMSAGPIPSNVILNKELIELSDTQPKAPQQVSVKQGVPELFGSNPELANIGTPQQYSQYLDTIFPDSKVKDIVYHGTPDGQFENFDVSKAGKVTGTSTKGVYFTDSKRTADFYAEGSIDFSQFESLEEYEAVKTAKVFSVILNAKTLNLVDNPQAQEKQGDAVLRTKEKLSDIGLTGYTPDLAHQYIVFKPEQIHILGSEKDIEGFKNFVSTQQQADKSRPEDETSCNGGLSI